MDPAGIASTFVGAIARQMAAGSCFLVRIAGGLMPTYVSLINWTEQGIKNVPNTIKRAEEFSRSVQRAGGTVRELLWTVGEYDLVHVVEFPDDESAVAALLRLGSAGNIHSH